MRQGAYVITGQDTIIINGKLLADFSDGDVGTLTFPNDVVGMKTGKNGNAMYSFNSTGLQAEMALRILRGSADDKYLNGLLNGVLTNFRDSVLATGEFTKNLGDGKGNQTDDSYILSGGVITKQVEAASNAEGGSDQAVAVYHFKWGNAQRVIA